jgi:hypothetical protein
MRERESRENERKSKEKERVRQTFTAAQCSSQQLSCLLGVKT